MKNHYKVLAGILLLRASDYFANRGCNDFDLVEEGKIPRELVEELNREYMTWNGTQIVGLDGKIRQMTPEEMEEDIDSPYSNDAALMHWLGDMLLKEAEQSPP